MSSGSNGARPMAGTSNLENGRGIVQDRRYGFRGARKAHQTLPPSQTMAVSADNSRKVVPPATESEKVLPLTFLNKTRTGRS